MIRRSASGCRVGIRVCFCCALIAAGPAIAPQAPVAITVRGSVDPDAATDEQDGDPVGGFAVPGAGEASARINFPESDEHETATGAGGTESEALDVAKTLKGVSDLVDPESITETGSAEAAAGPAGSGDAGGSGSEDGSAAPTVGLSLDPQVVPTGAALERWGRRLRELGLGPAEVGHTLGILRFYALDQMQMTVIYRLDPAELDRRLPIEVTPAPRDQFRVGLVVLLNADPDLQASIDVLVAQLGDPAWPKREEAQKRLAEFGEAARIKLEEAVEHEDVEIVYRAEQLLGELAGTAEG